MFGFGLLKRKQAVATANTTGVPRTGGYKGFIQSWFNQPVDLPIFSFSTIDQMQGDPGVRLNLATRSAPLAGAQFGYKIGETWTEGIQCSDAAVSAYVYRQLQKIWKNSLPAILRSQTWGWSAGEITMRLADSGLVEINKLEPRHATHCRLLKIGHKRSGIAVSNVAGAGRVDLEFPYCWFHSYNAEDGQEYGSSCLLGAYSPWADKWFNGGAIAVRRLFMHTSAFGGVELSYPDGTTFIDGTSIPVPNSDIARQIVEQIQSGGVVTLPSAVDGLGNPLWVLKRATVPSAPTHILQFPKDLDDEIRHGMEIPDDVISADGGGSWAGKRVTVAAFYASLDHWIVQIIADLKEQVFDPLCLINFGFVPDYDICHKPLAEQAMEQQSNAGPGKDQQQNANPYQVNGETPRPKLMSLENSLGAGELSLDSILRLAAKAISVQRMSAVHAPAGGVTVQGKKYVGGEFIPGDVVASATEDEKQKIAGGKDRSATTDEANAKKAIAFSKLMESKSPEDRKAFESAKNDGIAIPPAWSEVTYHGKDADIIAEGRDAKGRRQRAENPAYRQRISDENNQRIATTLTPKMPQLRKQLRSSAQAGNEEAKVLYLIAMTGFRIGGKGDGKADTQAFGASTLTGDHVTVDGNHVAFNFTGKKGVQQVHTMADPVIADMCRNAKPGKPIFNTRDTKVRDAWKKLGGVKVHDIRHVVASELATREINKLIPPKPDSKKKIAAFVKQVGTIVGAKLGNNPSQAIGTYIDPGVWKAIA